MLAPPSAGGFGAAGVPENVSPGDIPEHAASKAPANTTASRHAVRPFTAHADRSTIMRFAPFGLPGQLLTTSAPTVLEHAHPAFCR
jgi:hypothetical protein